MTDIGPTGGMSDGDIMMWLEQKSQDQYGDLRNQMSASTERGEVIKDLAQLGAAAQRDMNPESNFNRIQDVMTKDKDSPEYAEIAPTLFHYQIKMLAGMSDGGDKIQDLSNAIDAAPIDDAQKKALHGYLDTAQSVLNGTASDDDINNYRAAATAATTFTQLGDDLKPITDDLGRVDGLALIKIQQLVADAKQSDQLASNMLASREQTNNTIVGNFRA